MTNTLLSYLIPHPSSLCGFAASKHHRTLWIEIQSQRPHSCNNHCCCSASFLPYRLCPFNKKIHAAKLNKLLGYHLLRQLLSLREVFYNLLNQPLRRAFRISFLLLLLFKSLPLFARPFRLLSLKSLRPFLISSFICLSFGERGMGNGEW